MTSLIFAATNDIEPAGLEVNKDRKYFGHFNFCDVITTKEMKVNK